MFACSLFNTNDYLRLLLFSKLGSSVQSTNDSTVQIFHKVEVVTLRGSLDKEKNYRKLCSQLENNERKELKVGN